MIHYNIVCSRDFLLQELIDARSRWSLSESEIDEGSDRSIDSSSERRDKRDEEQV